jgi:hypothetical protein
MPTKKHYKNRLLTQIGRAIGDLRIALEYAETAGDLPDEASVIQERINDLVDLNNQVEGL